MSTKSVAMRPNFWSGS